MGVMRVSFKKTDENTNPPPLIAQKPPKWIYKRTKRIELIRIQKPLRFRRRVEAVDKVALLLKRNSVIAFREASLSRMVLAGIQLFTLIHCFY